MIEKILTQELDLKIKEIRQSSPIDMSEALKITKRNIRADQLGFNHPELAQHLECPICCQLYYSSTKRTARGLSCGHVMCNECIKKYFVENGEGELKRECPYCRQTVKTRTLKGKEKIWSQEDLVVKQLAKTLRYKCPFSKLGCKWMTESIQEKKALKSVCKHLEVCKHRKLLVEQIKEEEKREEERKKEEAEKLKQLRAKKIKDQKGEPEHQDDEPMTLEKYVEDMIEADLIQHAEKLDIYLTAEFLELVKEVFGEDFEVASLQDMTLIQDLEGAFTGRNGSSKKAFYRLKDLKERFEAGGGNLTGDDQ